MFNVPIAMFDLAQNVDLIPLATLSLYDPLLQHSVPLTS